MRAAARILALVLAAASPASGQNAPVQHTDTLDPTPPGTLHPEPLPPLINPDAPSTPAMELFARKPTPFPGPARSEKKTLYCKPVSARIARRASNLELPRGGPTS